MSQDWRGVPLSGRILVEASAGTGKTWTLAMLYLRLLLEGDGLTPEHIAVSTFTEAAAQELRGRIGARLREALAVLQGEAAGDEALRDLLHASATQADSQRQRLRLALIDLDRAPIGTLHGLCLRVLREYPLETGSDALGLELLDEAALRRSLIDDLWRALTQADAAAQPFTAQLLRDGRDWLQRHLPGLLQPGLQVREPDPQALADCSLLAEAEHAPALRRLADDDGLFRQRNSALRGELRALADLLEDDGTDPELGKRGFPRLSEAHRDLQTLHTQLSAEGLQRLASDADFLFAVRAGAAAAASKRILRGAALAWCRKRYLSLREQHLLRTPAIGYDDMIERVHRAMLDPGGQLAERLFDRWPVALIDEFQDTDPRQYALFDRLFRHPHGGARGTLLLVGDPKQAIYRFRGGDIHTYQRAAAGRDAQLTLRVNHRSSRAMVDALNTLYARAGDGFRIPEGDDHFGYVEVQASTRRDATPWCEGGAALERPLSIHALPLAEDPVRAAERVSLAIESCAALIAETLASGSVRVGDAPLHPGQIAVLLPRHSDVGAMRRALRRRGIASSGATRSDVFSTEWARALQLQLWAWLNPEQGDALRAALRTPLYGWPLATLHPSLQDAGALAAAQRMNAALAERWQRAGIAAAVGALVDLRSEALLADPEGGERAITDLRHLAELLATAEAEGHRNEALWHWLAAQREQSVSDADARQLRIESDSLRVRLMTLHASKGLEFDWVLLPLLWNHSPRSPEWPITWDPHDMQRVLDLGSADHADAVQGALVEDQRERLRVLYVALTRAVYRCDVWAMHPSRAASARTKSAAPELQRSALDLLLQPLFDDAAAAELPGIRWQTSWPESADQVRMGLPAPALPPWPALPAPPQLEVLASFSSLTHRQRSEPRQAQDEVDTEADSSDLPAAPHAELLAWEPLRGTQVGNALHAIFERRDPALALGAQRTLIADCLREHGWDPGLRSPAWVTRIAERLQAVLEADLGDGLCLAALPARAQRAEMDFRLRLDGVSLSRLRQVLEAHGEPALLPRSVPQRHLHGLLNGKIDLVLEHAGQLHVLDYKSNRLGTHLEDYRGASLQRAMEHSGYRFQALLYTLAVHRYLRQRLPDYAPARQLGSAWYLFLRGVGLDAGCGVWRQRFSPDLIEAVDAVFAGAQR